MQTESMHGLMMRLWIAMMVSTAAVFCPAASADAWKAHAPAAELMHADPIHLTASGQLSVAYETACRMVMRDNFLETIQQGYAQTLPPGETAEFTVQQTAPGQYDYVNRKGRQTRIEELVRRMDPDGEVEMVLYTEGVRFFGPFQSLCLITARPAGPDAVDWSVEVYARPESAAVRWFARLTPVELFFRSKTRHMSELVAEVCTQMMSGNPAPAAALHTAESRPEREDG